jgi:hypothetical protein
MKFAVGCLFVASLYAHVEGQAQRRQAVALFSNVEQGPAFMLECLNTSAAAIRAPELIREIALRVDGKLYEHTGGLSGSFLGGIPVFEPGQSWRVMLGLRQGSAGTKSSDFGAVLRIPWLLPLEAGRHTIAVRCAGNWSEETEFYWENAIVPR